MERVRLSYVLMINVFGMDLPDYHVLALRISISRARDTFHPTHEYTQPVCFAECTYHLLI